MTSMNHRPGRDQSQTPLFPACLKDYVTPENPVRSLDNFVASLDVAILVFAAAAAHSVPAVPPPNLGNCPFTTSKPTGTISFVRWDTKQGLN
jgi:hypothetical protein